MIFRRIDDRMDHQRVQIIIDERSSFLLIEFSTFEQCETTEESVGGVEWLVLVVIYVSRWRLMDGVSSFQEVALHSTL